MNPRAVLLAFTILTATSLPAESLRGTVQGEVVPDGPAVSLGLGDLAEVTLPPSTKFTRALEIEITVPREWMPLRSNLAVYIYQNFQPGRTGSAPSGDHVGTEVLPPAAKFYLEAPLAAKAGLKAAVDTAVLKLPRFDESFPLGISVRPIDKDALGDLPAVPFTVRSKLMNTNLGSLVVVTPGLSDDDRKRLKISVNGVPQQSEGPILLEPGPYTLEVTLPGVDTQTQTVVVTQAKTTEVPVTLSQEEPTLVIEAPEGTLVVIDGKRLNWKPSGTYPIDRGVHSVQFVLGNTVVSDSINIDQGGRHRLTLRLSISLKAE